MYLALQWKILWKSGRAFLQQQQSLGAVTVQLPLVEVVLLMFHLQVLVLIVLIDLYFVCLYILALIHFWLRQHFDN